MKKGQVAMNANLTPWGERLERIIRSGLLDDDEIYWLILGRNLDYGRVNRKLLKERQLARKSVTPGVLDNLEKNDWANGLFE